MILFDGDRYYWRKDKDKATQRYQEALSMNPKLAQANFRLGVLSDHAGNSDEAQALFKKAVDLSPDTPLFRNSLAYCYYLKGQY